MKSGFKSAEVPKEIPFSHRLENLGNINERTRLKHYRRFIGTCEEPCLDVGERNWMGEQLAQQLGVTIDNTLESNFNAEVIAHGPYRTIFCFEVLEHVMNPALFLSQLRELLSPGGTLYLSTPKLAVIPVYQTDMHFVEYKKEGLEALMNYCGYRIEKKEIFTPFPLWWGATGFRPFFRVLFHRIFLYKLTRI